MPPSAHLPAVSLLLLTLAGCGSKEGGHVAVTGTVTLGGEPLPGALVTFLPTDSTQGIGAEARTGPDGVYRLIDRRGAAGTLPGTYKVTISKRVMPDGSDPDPNVPPIRSPARESLPPTVADPSRTTLKADVPDHGGTIDFPLPGPAG